MENDKISNEVAEQVKDFFDRYPEAKKCYTSGSQVFHANAKDAADARSAYYGLTTVEHTKSNKESAKEFTDILVAKLTKDKFGENTERGEMPLETQNSILATENTEGGEVPQTDGLTQGEKEQIAVAVENAQKTNKKAAKPAKNTKS